jgi:hypothetical protein
MNDDPFRAIAALFRGAEYDGELRKQLEFLIRLPSLQRQSIVNTSLHEMALRGEPRDVQVAFGLLATDEGAEAARRWFSQYD